MPLEDHMMASLGDSAPDETSDLLASDEPQAADTPEEDPGQETPDTEEESPDADAPADDDTPPDRSLVEQVEGKYGLKLGKFKSNEDFLDSTAENIRAIGRRDENAEIGKRLRDKFSGAELDDILAGKAAQEPPAESNGKPPQDDDEWDPAWVTFNEKGQPVAAYGAPADVEKRYMARQHRVISNFDKMLADQRAEILGEIKKHRQEEAATDAQQREQTETEGVFDRHKDLLFIGGDHAAGLTGDGEKVREYLHDDTWKARCPRELDRLQMAVDFVQAQRPKTKPAAAPRKAMRQPGVASAPETQKSIVELINEGKGLKEACTAGEP